ncbi:MAG: trypsin-like peptidase domain-containing protein [Armatimonadota bacterium]|nr:trypsin-like peptidase domain-containing protein [bacterium]
MKRFISYVAVFVIGFVVCAGVLFRWYGKPAGNNGPVFVPTVSRAGIGLDKPVSSPVRKAAAVVSNYVVNIDTVGKPVHQPGGFGDFPDFFGFPFSAPEEVIPKGQASGVIYTSDGYIVTNNHVVENAARLTVTLHNGRKYSAKLIGRDPKTDLAVVKIDAKNLPYARFAKSNTLQVGDWVIAVGNALGLGPTVTVGVVSAKRTVDIDGKKLEGVIQTDAAINRGNSGGALADINGNLVGINTAILSTSPGGGNIGIGFAIPSNNVSRIADQLQKHGAVIHPWLGVGYGPFNSDMRKNLERRGVTKLPKQDGAIVAKVYEGSPAAEAGLQPGDIILKVNGKPVSVSENPGRGKTSIADAVSKAKVGDRLVMEVWQASDNQIVQVAPRLKQMPADFTNQQ